MAGECGGEGDGGEGDGGESDQKDTPPLEHGAGLGRGEARGETADTPTTLKNAYPRSYSRMRTPPFILAPEDTPMEHEAMFHVKPSARVS